MKKPLFIAIGVQNSYSMQVLDGVLKSIDDLTTWATSRGYDVVKIDDRIQKVSINRVRETLTPIEGVSPSPALLLDRPRIIVYFCGHGLHAPQDQYWILSAGPDQPRERISAVGFRDTLATYGPNQIAFFSDACRSPKAVIGQGDPVVDAYEADVGYPQKDIFFSSREGYASFAVPAQNERPAYCVFSETLVKALSMPDGDNLDKLYSQLGRKLVTSQSLADYLVNHVPVAALNAGKIQMPQCDPGFRPVINDYIEFTEGDKVNQKPGQISIDNNSLSVVKTSSIDFVDDFGGLGSEDSSDTPKEPLPEINVAEFEKYSVELSQKRQSERINQSRSEWRVPFVNEVQHFISNLYTNPCDGNQHGPILVVSDYCPLLIGPTTYKSNNGWLIPHLFLKKSKGHWFWDAVGFFQTDKSSVLIANSEELYAPITTYRDLWCALTFSRPSEQQDDYAAIGGVDLLAWGEYYCREAKGELQAAEALKGLSAGTLNSEDIKLFTQNMRIFKHADPILGIVSAYLYNGIGDVDNIRRMCYYYSAHHQDVPFDIAMLANLPLRRVDQKSGFVIDIPKISEALHNPDMPSFTWESTPEVPTLGVAGVTPILRVGWQHVRYSKHKIHKQCWELIDHMTESPISTFSGDDVGKLLIKAFKEF